ncbi:DUF4079 family protein [Pleurocapsales cyanobacterium LEGE 06147]|nr:DUF4079 family protein [Pleurocapsales cyanobacterium LEGE 06147]
MNNIKFLLNFIHPILMWALLFLTLYALYLGIQVRRTRTATGEAKKIINLYWRIFSECAPRKLCECIWKVGFGFDVPSRLSNVQLLLIL